MAKKSAPTAPNPPPSAPPSSPPPPPPSATMADNSKPSKTSGAAKKKNKKKAAQAKQDQLDRQAEVDGQAMAGVGAGTGGKAMIGSFPEEQPPPSAAQYFLSHANGPDPTSPPGATLSYSGPPLAARSQTDSDFLATANDLFKQIEVAATAADAAGRDENDEYWNSLPPHLRSFIRQALPLAAGYSPTSGATVSTAIMPNLAAFAQASGIITAGSPGSGGAGAGGPGSPGMTLTQEQMELATAQIQRAAANGDWGRFLGGQQNRGGPFSTTTTTTRDGATLSVSSGTLTGTIPLGSFTLPLHPHPDHPLSAGGAAADPGYYGGEAADPDELLGEDDYLSDEDGAARTNSVGGTDAGTGAGKKKKKKNKKKATAADGSALPATTQSANPAPTPAPTTKLPPVPPLAPGQTKPSPSDVAMQAVRDRLALGKNAPPPSNITPIPATPANAKPNKASANAKAAQAPAGGKYGPAQVSAAVSGANAVGKKGQQPPSTAKPVPVAKPTTNTGTAPMSQELPPLSSGSAAVQSAVSLRKAAAPPTERERIRDFWLTLNQDERAALVKVEKDAVLRKMKEQQRHGCACAVCGRKRMAIEEELEVLYDAYYDELESYAEAQRKYASSGGALPPPPGPGPFPGSVDVAAAGPAASQAAANAAPKKAVPKPTKDHKNVKPKPASAAAKKTAAPMTAPPPSAPANKTTTAAAANHNHDDPHHTHSPSCPHHHHDHQHGRGKGTAVAADPLEEDDADDDEDDEDEYDDDEEEDYDEDEEDDGEYDDDEDIPALEEVNDAVGKKPPVNGTVKSTAKPPAQGDFGFGNSLTVKGGILTVADDLLRNDGQKFLEMMESLADKRIRREKEAAESVLASFDDEEDDDEYDDEEDEEDEDDEDLEDEDVDDEVITEEQRMEEGRRMFQIFAARMFEQRVLTAYREKVAQEKQAQLLRELEDEDQREKEREMKKVKDAQKKKEKKKAQKQQKDQDSARKAAEKEAEEAAARAAEEKRLEAERRRQDEQRLKREAQRKQQEEERARKEEEKRKRLEEEARKRKEKEEKARLEKEARQAKEREERDRKAKIEAERKERLDAERREREAKEAKVREEADRKAKEEAEKREAERREAERVETERREAERKEVERREAERREAAKQAQAAAAAALKLQQPPQQRSPHAGRPGPLLDPSMSAGKLPPGQAPGLSFAPQRPGQPPRQMSVGIGRPPSASATHFPTMPPLTQAGPSNPPVRPPSAQYGAPLGFPSGFGAPGGGLASGRQPGLPPPISPFATNPSSAAPISPIATRPFPSSAAPGQRPHNGPPSSGSQLPPIGQLANPRSPSLSSISSPLGALHLDSEPIGPPVRKPSVTAIGTGAPRPIGPPGQRRRSNVDEGAFRTAFQNGIGAIGAPIGRKSNGALDSAEATPSGSRPNSPGPTAYGSALLDDDPIVDMPRRPQPQQPHSATSSFYSSSPFESIGVGSSIWGSTPASSVDAGWGAPPTPAPRETPHDWIRKKAISAYLNMHIGEQWVPVGDVSVEMQRIHAETTNVGLKDMVDACLIKRTQVNGGGDWQFQQQGPVLYTRWVSSD